MVQKSSRRYFAIKKAVDSGKYRPSDQYRTLKWSKLTGRLINQEYKRMRIEFSRQKFLKQIAKFERFVKSKQKNYEVKIDSNEKVFNLKLKKFFGIIAESDDKFIAELGVEDVATGQIRPRLKAINKSNAVELIESLTVDENYDQVFSNLNVIRTMTIKRLDKPKAKPNKREGAYFPYYNKNNSKINLL